MSDDVVIQTRALGKVYRDFWGRQKVRALKPLDLEIHRGEVFGLLGPNGSGKTTTIKLILGLLFPTEGEALVFGKRASDVSKNERIGYLPEESYLYRFLNAEETLDSMLGYSTCRQRRGRLGLIHSSRRWVSTKRGSGSCRSIPRA
jgi:ABC-2 type transport system ATP-binding protein